MICKALASLEKQVFNMLKRVPLRIRNKIVVLPIDERQNRIHGGFSGGQCGDA